MHQNLVKNVDWQKCGGLVPAIIQDVATLKILMLGFMNEEALTLTLETKKIHFWSRSKNRIWMKGESSGNILDLVEISLDCDQDSLLLKANPRGNVCHKETQSCFDGEGQESLLKKSEHDFNFLMQIEKIIENRMANRQKSSYVANLCDLGINKIAQKVGEEATEVVIAALNEGDSELANESADLLFHLMILLKNRGLSLSDVLAIMKSRNNQ